MATRMQQRRGTAEQWTLVNPTLAEGEIGFETDTNQFKIGNGVNAWGSLPYFETLDDIQTYVNNAVAGVIDAAPGTLDTLNELAAAINDDSDFFNSITTAYQAYADQAEVDAKAYADTQDAAQTASITAAYQAYVDGQTADSATVTYVDTQDATTLVDAQTYADAGDTATLTTANAYTDARETAITTAYQSYADTAESDAVTAANAYTDTRETAITSAYQSYADQAEADAVATANTNADSLIGDITVDGTAGNTVTDRISSAVSSLVDAAPATLDTLNELAAALGDDANFATTVANDIASKISKSGGTMTGDLTLANDPTSNLQAATKQYVDTQVASAEPTFTNNFMLMGA